MNVPPGKRTPDEWMVYFNARFRIAPEGGEVYVVEKVNYGGRW